MFCKNCGTEMNDTDKFCLRCGYARIGEQTQKSEIIEDNRIRFQLKPKFEILYQLLSNIGYAFLYMFCICCLITNLYKLWFEYPSTLLITVVIMVIYVIGKMIFGKMQYDDLEYNFYATKVEYKDGFINKEEKELKYKYVREVTMSQNILERFCGIGTIKIFTSASSGGDSGRNHGSMNGRNGLYIHCVGNVQEQYRIIKEIIDEGTPDEY